MSDSLPPDHDHDTHSYSENDLLDRLCDQFERELKAGSQPKIEDYLGMAPPSLRDRMLGHLILLDYDYASRIRKVDFAEYRERFPDAGELLRDLESKLEQKQDLTQISDMTGDQTVVAIPESKHQFNHFRLLDVAGSGGFGTVWRARDLRLDREVAIKIPRPDRTDPIHLSGLLREAKAAAKLKHPNIVAVHEIGEENGTSYIVTDFVHGVNLREWRKKNPLTPHKAAKLVAKLAEAVQHAHEHGIIHRDLKLGNILMDMQGEPHVADFGLAKSEAHDDSLAITGQVLGTPAYMAPEQARADHAAIDRRTDVYSIGVMLYELMTGTTPFRGAVPELLQQLLNLPPISPRKINPEIPKDLEAICLKCLAKENAKRYDSARALADDLYLFINGETIRGVPASVPDRLGKWLYRNRRLAWLIASTAIVVAAASASLVAWRYNKFLPQIPLETVEFTTDSNDGCEITVVAIDPSTGEPDPNRIQTASQKATLKTPVTMKLPAGDYLVVAGIPDSLRFNEVYRHVPAKNEETSGKSAQESWNREKRKSGIIAVPVIPIPRPDVAGSMGFCEGTVGLVEITHRPIDQLNTDDQIKTWRIPDFFCDLHEISLEEFKNWNLQEGRNADGGAGTMAIQRYYEFTGMLEKNGKRLPTAAELYYLSTVVCPKNPKDELDLPCVLPDKKVIVGLHSGIWEWTSTKPGGPFSGMTSLPKGIGIDATLRMIGCGDSQIEGGKSRTGFRAILEHIAQDAGARGVRSSKPRRKREDFPTYTVGPTKTGPTDH